MTIGERKKEVAPYVVDGEVFVLDRESNPHPDMRDYGLQLRRTARAADDPIVGAMWLGYLECMCRATGLSSEVINDWLDWHDDFNLVSSIATSLPMPGVRRR